MTIPHSRTAPTRLHGLTAALLGGTALVGLLSTSAFAQQVATHGDAVDLAPIVVEGGGDSDESSIVATGLSVGGKVATDILDTAATVSVITAQEIELRNAQSVEEVLSYTPGIVTDFYGADDRFDFIRIRGFEAFTYRDGLTVGSSFGGIREEPYAYERVEVFKGANSTLFGVSDPGGSVNYVTKKPKTERFGEVYGTAGTFSHAEIGFDFGDNLNKAATLSYRLTGKVQDSDLEYDHSRDDEQFLMGGLTWRPGDATTVTVIADYLKNEGTPNDGGHPFDVDVNRGTFFGEPDLNYLDTERRTLNVMVDHDFFNGLTFSSNLRYSEGDIEYGYLYHEGRGGYDPYADPMMPRDYITSDWEGEEFVGNAQLAYDGSFGNVASHTLIGVEFGKTSSESYGLYGNASPINWRDPEYSGKPDLDLAYVSNDYEAESETTAVYLQQDLTFADRVIASVGLRHDWISLSESGTRDFGAVDNDEDFEDTTVRAGLTYKITPELSTYVSYAESVAPPDFGVEPVSGEQYEFGVKYQPAGTNALITASIYDLTKENEAWYDSATATTFVLDEVRVRGFDLEAKAELIDNLNLIAGYSYMDSEFDDAEAGLEGKVYPFIPEHSASLWADYTLEGTGNHGDMTFGLGARYSGAYYFAHSNDTGKSDDVVLFDAAYSYEIQDGLDLALNVTNLFDEKHVVARGTADYYNPGRTVALTLRHSW